MIKIIALICLIGTPDAECTPETAHSMASTNAGRHVDMDLCRHFANEFESDPAFIKRAKRADAFAYTKIKCVEASDPWTKAAR